MPLLVPQVPLRGLDTRALTESLKEIGKCRVAIVRCLWNEVVVTALCNGCKSELEKHGADVEVFQVVGAFELPFAARMAAETGRFDAVVAIGVLFKGETLHFEYISQGTVHGLTELNLRGNVPVINGVLHCLTDAQALARAGLIDGENHGEGLALAALGQIAVKKAIMHKQ